MRTKKDNYRQEAKEVLKKLTIEEKCRLLTGERSIFTHGFPELGVPSVNMMDGAMGARRTYEENSVGFPCAALMASSFDRNVAYENGKHIAYEFENAGINTCLGPGNNMKRSPHCGRNFEYMSEDPYLGGVMAGEYSRGLEENGIGACIKHYAANNQEHDRTFLNVEVDEKTLRDYYLKAFEIAFDTYEPVSIMSAYNMINGVNCSENKFLLNEVLRGDYKFDGMVISDWHAVHDSAKCIAAGLDLEMCPNPDKVQLVLEGLKDGRVTEEEINKCAENVIVFAKRVANLPKIGYNYNRDEQHAAAQKLAAEGMVLLKNENNVLPVTNKKYKKILVAGSLAEKPVIQGAGAAKVLVQEDSIDKPLDYIRKYAEESGIEVVYDPVYENGTYIGAENISAINNLKKGDYDAIICFIGNNYGTDVETEHWDRDNIKFENYMNGFVHAAQFKCDNVIAVMQTGSATIPVHWHEEISGIIQMWYGGEGGGKAIADILFGKINPSGKLSETFITKERDIDPYGDGRKTWYSEGEFVGYRYYDENPRDVWYPFGHGLSYTEFVYSDIKTVKNSDSVDISFKIKNVGEVDGAEAAQVYIGAKKSLSVSPKKELCGFDKIYLKAGEEKSVSINVPLKLLRSYNVSLREYEIEDGVYNVYVGSSSVDIRLKDTFEISENEAVKTENNHVMA